MDPIFFSVFLVVSLTQMSPIFIVVHRLSRRHFPPMLSRIIDYWAFDFVTAVILQFFSAIIFPYVKSWTPEINNLHKYLLTVDRSLGRYVRIKAALNVR